MRFRNKLVLLALAPLCAAGTFSFHVMGDDSESWPAVLNSIGLLDDAETGAGVVIAPPGTTAPAAEWTARVNSGTILVVEGESPLAAAFGFHPSAKPHVIAQSVEDVHAPKLRIIWEKPLDVAVFDLPTEARVFARERWTGAPLIAGFRRGVGGVLWIAAPLGVHGYERFPYIPQALADLGLAPPFHSRRLWAFFDSAYRSRVDLDYFAARWREAGIGALDVAAWHYWERDPQSDQYLRDLLEACHRHAISVYAWFEFPHVSDKFWLEHPAWREKTALLQDAQLDWRKLINLENPEASAAVSRGMRDLVTRFDWDGVNLAELYFESLEGASNPARFTPMNNDVRAEYKKQTSVDPLDLFRTGNAAEMKKFLDFRAGLAHHLQAAWLDQVDQIRKTKPQLDLVLTHVDDRFDATMRDKIGADVSATLPLLSEHDFTFLIEDPATIWNLGPQRYAQIADRYRPLTPRQDKLAIDINIVERYQDVYPTKQQTGTELFELVHSAAAAFPRVALYFENSILRQDWPLLASAASTVARVERVGAKLAVESKESVAVDWQGPALVDGALWPATNDSAVLLPAGSHAVEPAPRRAPLRLLDFNGDLRSASVGSGSIEIAYESSARAMAKLDRTPEKIEIDGAPAEPQLAGDVLILPRGQHLVTLFTPSPDKGTGR